MAITVQYNPSFIAGGQLAAGAGQGEFLKDQSRFDYQRLDADRRFGLAEDQFGLAQDRFGESIRQFDASLAQRGSEYDRNLQQRVNETQLRDNQFNQQLQQRDSLARRQMEEQAYQAELRAQSRNLATEAQQRMQAAQLQARERADIRSIENKQQAQMFGLGNQEMNRIEQAFGAGKLSPAEYAQVKDQWVGKYGHLPMFGGEYPADMPQDPGDPHAKFEAKVGQLSAGFGMPSEAVAPFLNDDGSFIDGTGDNFFGFVDKENDRKHKLRIEEFKVQQAEEKAVAKERQRVAILKELRDYSAEENRKKGVAKTEEDHRKRYEGWIYKALEDTKVKKVDPTTDAERSWTDTEIAEYMAMADSQYRKYFPESVQPAAQQQSVPQVDLEGLHKTNPGDVVNYNGDILIRLPNGKFDTVK